MTNSSNHSCLLLQGTHIPHRRGFWQNVSGIIDMNTFARDVTKLENSFQQAGIGVFAKHSYTTTPKSKVQFMKVIDSFFEQPASYFVLYWSGHGEDGTGDWLLSDTESISLYNLVQGWKKALKKSNKPKKQFLIISDCCYSGCWVQKLNENKEKYSNYNLTVQSACTSKELAYYMLDKEGSCLTAKIVQELSVKNKTSISTFEWRSEGQHPRFATTLSPKYITHDGEQFFLFGKIRVFNLY